MKKIGIPLKIKLLAFLLLLVLISCKNETKTENEIDISIIEMWGNYTATHPEFAEDDLPETFFFHDNEVDANRLTVLVLEGKKQAGSSLYFWYEEANADLPEVGTKSIVTDFYGKAKAIIETKKIDTIPFNKITATYAALDMGTTDDALNKWKKAHWDFFAPAMEQSGVEPTEDMLIVCEWFETIWTEMH